MTREGAIKSIQDFMGWFKKDKHIYEALDMAIKALSAEPCEDAISRAEAMTEIMMFAGNVKPDEENIYIKVSDAVQLLRELPPVTPKQKMGCWINYQKNIWIYTQCSECGTVHDTKTNYCPNCGAKMEVSENG